MPISHSGIPRFLGLFGLYYSLQYLSLSDATVITFLTPICTMVTGAIFLKETVYMRQIVAGRGLPFSDEIIILLIWPTVFSFLGVVLIARPPFIFHGISDGINSSSNPVQSTGKDHTVTQRLTAVGWVSYSCIRMKSSRIYEDCDRVALIGVLGATGACELWLLRTSPSAH